MSTTDETKAQGDGADAGPPPKRQPGWVKPAKRYGPIVVVIALIGAAVLVFGGGAGGRHRRHRLGSQLRYRDGQDQARLRLCAAVRGAVRG